MYPIAQGLVAIVLSLTAVQETSAQNESAETSILQKVANAHGFENWKDVTTLKFTFNVDRGSDHFERSWVWNTDTNDITMTTAEDSLTYNRNDLQKGDSTVQKADAHFINDKFWLLAPYQLVWNANNIEHEHTAEATAPISDETMQKLTIVYSSEGGYTPGDAYDFYFGDDLIVREWVYRKGNQKEASVTSTWEGYEDFKGLKIATMHKNADGNSKLHFTGIEVLTE